MRSDPGATVATLVAARGAAPALREAAAQLVAAHAAAAVEWLGSHACDIRGGGIGEAAARAAIGAAPIDVVVQPEAGRRKRLLVADCESTVIENEMIDELADFLGLREHVAAVTRRAMNGEIDFAAALAERVALLRGLPESVLDDARARIRLMPGAAALVATLRRDGVATALVSGGFTVFVEPVAATLGFGRVIANRLDVADGKIAGTVPAPIVDAAAKRTALLALCGEQSVAADQAMAVGDGANDLPMLAAAGLGVAFRAKPAVAAAARWRIDHADLTALLFVQGYRESEIAVP